MIRRLLRAISPWPHVRRDETPTHHHELDALAGTWSAEEAAEFERAVTARRGIEPDIRD